MHTQCPSRRVSKKCNGKESRFVGEGTFEFDAEKRPRVGAKAGGAQELTGDVVSEQVGGYA